jgi:putative ABC transport system ATP-binding protein
METPTVIQLQGIQKLYQTGGGKVHAVRGVDLDLKRGDFVAIMGSSGSGKSTLMNMIGCLDRPSAGSYKLDGLEVSKLSRDELADIRNQKIGFVFQSFNLLARTSALENVELPLLYRRGGPGAKEKRAQAWAALKLVGLAERWHHHPSQLSGGQQQRVAIARALAVRPSLLLADEPTGNLDSATTVEIMGIFQKLNEDGMTVVMVTHELDVASFAKRMIVMRDGKVIKDEQVLKRLDAKTEQAKLREEMKENELH